MLRYKALCVTATLLIASCFSMVSASFAGATTVTTHDQAFVTAAYQDFLGRAPTSGELTAATATPLNYDSARGAVVSDLAHSPEWITVSVKKLYQDTLGRAPDPSGRAYWISVLSSGSKTLAQAAANFYSSSEYFNGFGHGSTATWIADLYTKILGRSVDTAGAHYWQTATAKHGRWWVAYSLYQSSESCHTRVADLYQTLLGRAPETGGWDYWASQVKKKGDLTLAASLASSNEYYERAWDRFGPPVPGRPTGVRTTLDGTDVTVSWVAPTNAGGSPITSYTVTSTPGAKTCTTTGALSCVVTGLAYGTPYTFHVVATNSFGDSRPSAPSGEVVAQPTFDGTWTKMAPLAVSEPWTPTGASNAGLLVGMTDSGHLVTCASPCTAPSELALPAGFHTASSSAGQFTAVGVPISNAKRAPRAKRRMFREKRAAVISSGTGQISVSESGTIVASAMDATWQSQILVWSSPTATPTLLTLPSNAVGVSFAQIAPNGTIFGSIQVSASSDPYDFQDAQVVWSSPSAQPVVLHALSDGTAAQVIGVTNAGQIIGATTGAFEVVGSSDASSTSGWVVWSSPSATPTRIALPSGGEYLNPLAVSTSGMLIGSVDDDQDNEQTLVWSSPSAQPSELALPNGATWIDSASVSSSGQIAALAYGPTGDTVGIVWSSPSAQPAVLSVPSGAITAVATSSSGALFGGSGNDFATEKALVWSSPSAQPTALANVTVQETPQIDAASSNGELVGMAGDGAFVWDGPNDTSPVQLGAPTGYTQITATGANATGMIVGMALDANGTPRGLVWANASAQPTVLAQPAGATYFSVAGVSSSGVIAGMAGTDDVASPYAVVWTSASAQPTVLALPSGVSYPQIDGVTPAGAIYGNGDVANGNSVGLVWSTPSSVATKLSLPTGTSGVYNLVMSSSGTIAGLIDSSSGDLQAVAWSSPSAQPTVLQLPTSQTDFASVAGTMSNMFVGYTFGNASPQLAVWASPTAIPTTIPLPTGVDLNGVQAVAESGQIAIASTNGDTWVYTP